MPLAAWTSTLPWQNLRCGNTGIARERRAAGHPTEKYTHLELAHVEFQIAGEPSVALFRRQETTFKIDTFRLHGAVDQKARSIVFVAGKREA